MGSDPAGNAAMDVARTAMRHGSREVTCFSLTKKITASDYEFSYAQLEGSDKLYPMDSTIISISQGPMNVIVNTTTGLDANKRGLLIADECGRTSRPGIFASGDVVQGARTVVEAVAYSKRVAEAMHAYIKSTSNADE